MVILLAVDPGIRGSGVALFKHGWLSLAGYVKNPAINGNDPVECASMAQAIDFWIAGNAFPVSGLAELHGLALEWPQVYTQGHLKGDPNDLLPLAGIDCALATLAPQADIKHYLPKQWKGQLSKEACEERMHDRLTEVERGRLEVMRASTPTSLQHNVFDAVGIGLHALGRFKPKRVISR